MKIKNTWIIAGVHAVHDNYTAFLPTLLPKLIEKLSINNTYAGLLSIFLQGPSVIQPFVGYASDKKNLIWIFILTPAVTGIGMSLAGASQSYTMLAVFLFIVGISSSLFHSLGSVAIGYQDKSTLGKSMGFWMLGGELGRTTGPVVIVLAVEFLMLEGTVWMFPGGILASILLYLRFRHSDTHGSRGHNPARLSTVWGILKKYIMSLILVIIGRSFLLAAVTTFLPVIITQTGEAYIWGGTSLFLVEAFGVVGAMAGGTTSDRWGRRKTIFLSMTVSAAFMGILGAIFFFQSGMHAWVFRGGYLVLLSVIGFTSLSVGPSFLALIQENFPDNRALANGVYLGLNFGIRSLVVLLFGIFLDYLSLELSWSIAAVGVLAGAFFIWRIPEFPK